MRALPHIDYDNHPAYRGVGDDEKLRRRVLDVFEPLLEEKRSALAAHLEAFQARAASSADSAVADLARDGVTKVRLPEATLSELRRLFAPVDVVRQQKMAEVRAEGRPVQARDTFTVLRSDHKVAAGMEDLSKFILKIVRSSGALDIARAYYPGYNCKPWNIIFRRNIPGQDYCRAKEMETSRTAGMHIDSTARPMLNGIIYLNEVGPDQGPFQYVAGSNQWAFDPEDRAARKAVDETGFSSSRSSFLQLPPQHRRKASFGFDVADGTDLSEALLARERIYTSDMADMVLFDSEGVHRGGDVREGCRKSILFSVKVTRKSDGDD